MIPLAGDCKDCRGQQVRKDLGVTLSLQSCGGTGSSHDLQTA